MTRYLTIPLFLAAFLLLLPPQATSQYPDRARSDIFSVGLHTSAGYVIDEGGMEYRRFVAYRPIDTAHRNPIGFAESGTGFGFGGRTDLVPDSDWNSRTFSLSLGFVRRLVPNRLTRDPVPACSGPEPDFGCPSY